MGKIKDWCRRNKKYILIGGTTALLVVGTGIGCVFYKKNKVSFSELLENAPTEELKEIYEKLRLEFCQTGFKPWGMEQISYELGARGAKEWFAKHPANTDLNFRWTDVNRWE